MPSTASGRCGGKPRGSVSRSRSAACASSTAGNSEATSGAEAKAPPAAAKNARRVGSVIGRAPLGAGQESRGPSGEDAVDDFAVDVRQAKVATGISVGQPLMVQPQQVEDRGMHVMDMNFLIDSIVSIVVGPAPS